tara:strand:+ start:784 stop:1542 length:759 start_codon:yes stop_codon:yes gene_type:complete
MTTRQKVALITGAGSGIGKHCAIALLNNGYSVSLAGRREDALAKTAAESGADYKNILIQSTDIADHSSVQQLFAKTKEKFGRLDVLFNNAGAGNASIPMEDLTLSQWKTVVDTNLTGTFLCTQEAIKIMKSQSPMGGRIINNGSISASTPRVHSAPYTASKHGITGLTKSTALDGRKYSIACSQIDIGNASTDMTQRHKTGTPQPSGDSQSEPTFDVQHVADSVLYIANLPLDTNILFMTIMATTMPFVGRG